MNRNEISPQGNAIHLGIRKWNQSFVKVITESFKFDTIRGTIVTDGGLSGLLTNSHVFLGTFGIHQGSILSKNRADIRIQGRKIGVSMSPWKIIWPSRIWPYPTDFIINAIESGPKIEACW